MIKSDRSSNDKISDIPEILHNGNNGRSYKRERFFGKGGFAKCYEIKDMQTGDVFAGKIVSKKMIVKSNQKEKMTQEIMIHKPLIHKNVVRFLSFFEDVQNVYIIMELCQKRSMMELHKRRRTITDFECRFFIHQILEGVKYLHDHQIIHRDLKLGNLFLNEDLNVKIGDFGLATRIEYEGERKKTLCGTPNYIAPEILSKKGHSYEVDIWSIGCVMFTLLVGQPPFETKSLKDTYTRIKKCEYRLPNSLRKSSAEMIIAMLQSAPERRPNVNQLFKYEFITNGYIPTSLPVSCLEMAPRYDQITGGIGNNGSPMINVVVLSPSKKVNRKPLVDIQDNAFDERGSPLLKNGHDLITASGTLPKNNLEFKADIENLYSQLTNLLNSQLKRYTNNLGDELTDPAAQPLFWISKWVDYSDKYGFGYQLCDEGMGVMFNDTTKIIMLANEKNVHFIDKDNQEKYMTINAYPPELEKKMKLLSYFKRYMTEHLVKAGAQTHVEADSISRIPHLHTWFRTSYAVVMHLTNGSVQLNFQDHMKIILCPRMGAVTYIDADKNFRTFRFSTITESGISNDLYTKLRYAHDKIKNLLQKLS